MSYKIVYQADDGTTLTSEAAAIFYEALKDCPYAYLSETARKHLAEHLVTQLSYRNKKDETLSTSISPKQDSSQSLDVAVRTSENGQEQIGGYSCEDSRA